MILLLLLLLLEQVGQRGKVPLETSLGTQKHDRHNGTILPPQEKCTPPSLGDDVCLTTGWPFLQVGAFYTPEKQKTTIILNLAAKIC